MLHRFIIASSLLMLLLGCARGERSSVVGLVKDVSASARPKNLVKVSIHTGAEQPRKEDDALLRSIESAIENEKIGRLVNSGAEPGYIFVTVEVENTADAIASLRSILVKAGVLKGSSFKVIAPG
jgi:hypothetical protein